MPETCGVRKDTEVANVTRFCSYHWLVSLSLSFPLHRRYSLSLTLQHCLPTRFQSCFSRYNANVSALSPPPRCPSLFAFTKHPRFTRLHPPPIATTPTPFLKRSGNILPIYREQGIFFIPLIRPFSNFSPLNLPRGG